MRTHPSSRVKYAEDSGGKKVNISKDSRLQINEGVTEMMRKLLPQQSATDIKIDTFDGTPLEVKYFKFIIVYVVILRSSKKQN